MSHLKWQKVLGSYSNIRPPSSLVIEAALRD